MYGVGLHFGDASVCKVGVDVCSERGVLGCGRPLRYDRPLSIIASKSLTDVIS